MFIFVCLSIVGFLFVLIFFIYTICELIVILFKNIIYFLLCIKKQYHEIQIKWFKYLFSHCTIFNNRINNSTTEWDRFLLRCKDDSHHISIVLHTFKEGDVFDFTHFVNGVFKTKSKLKKWEWYGQIQDDKKTIINKQHHYGSVLLKENGYFFADNVPSEYWHKRYYCLEHRYSFNRCTCRTLYTPLCLQGDEISTNKFLFVCTKDIDVLDAFHKKQQILHKGKFYRIKQNKFVELSFFDVLFGAIESNWQIILSVCTIGGLLITVLNFFVSIIK